MIAALLLAAVPAPSVPAPPPHGARLATYISSHDYPAEAIRRGEEGTVEVTILVSPQGRVAGCSVTGSSGSAILDETTCRLLAARARFIPAHDAAGRRVPDRVVGRIRWLLPR